MAIEIFPRHLEVNAHIEVLQKVLEGIEKDPPKLARAGMPLEYAPIDHVAVAFSNKEKAYESYITLVERDGRIIEPFALWPPEDDPNCPDVPDSDKKYMATVGLGLKGFKFVFLAPYTNNDIIAQHLARSNQENVHHIAFQVRGIKSKLSEILEYGRISQVTPLASDEYLSQVFLRDNGDYRIIELIERDDSFHGTFTCRNISTLTEGKRRYFKRKNG